MEDLARNHLEELIGFLSDDNSELSSEELMTEVCALVDNYRSELELDATEQEKNSILHLADENDEEEDEQDEVLLKAFQKLSSTNFNRGFLLGKAKDLYFKKAGLDEDTFSELSPADKVKHRKLITKVFNDLVIKEAQKPTKNKRISEYGGAIKRTRMDDLNDPIDIDDGVTDAEVSFYKGQIKELRKVIRATKAEIEQTERQNKLEKVSSTIISRNLDRVEDLKDELSTNEKELKFYLAKMKD